MGKRKIVSEPDELEELVEPGPGDVYGVVVVHQEGRKAQGEAGRKTEHANPPYIPEHQGRQDGVPSVSREEQVLGEEHAAKGRPRVSVFEHAEGRAQMGHDQGHASGDLENGEGLDDEGKSFWKKDDGQQVEAPDEQFDAVGGERIEVDHGQRTQKEIVEPRGVGIGLRVPGAVEHERDAEVEEHHAQQQRMEEIGPIEGLGPFGPVSHVEAYQA